MTPHPQNAPSSERPVAVDWHKAKTEYAGTNLSLTQMARRLGVSLRSVQRHSVADGWCRAREEYRRKSAAAAQAVALQAATDDLASSITDIRRREDHLALTLLAALQAALDLAQKQLEDLQDSEDPRPFDDLLAILELAAPIVAEIRKSTVGPNPQSADALVASLQRLTTSDRVDIYKASLN